MKRKVLYLMMCLMSLSFAAHAQVNSVALVGEAAGGWPGDPGNPGPTDLLQMTSTDGVNWSLSAVTLTNANTGGGVKFRANNDWSINWGAASFPDGIGVANGANIPCIGGTYDVTFNSTTGEYHFIGGTPVAIVKIVGSAVITAGGESMTTTNGELYTLANATLLDGTAQFDIEGSLFGGDTFPTGTVVDNTLNIPVVAGSYTSVSVNIATGEYSFVAAPLYPLISLIGSAVGGWGVDSDMTTADGITYTYKALAVNGVAPDNELKFRTNHDWGQPNYGGSGWPSGNATTTGGNITAGASGTYDVTFNLTTGDYTFSVPTIAIVGSATPNGWPSDPQVDASVLTTTDNGVNYVLNSVTLSVGDLKFRANNGWAVNWGSSSFPAGVGTQDGANIAVTTAGDYSVTLNRVTGAYAFGDPLATKSFSTANFKVYPNPSNSVWNFASTANKNIVSIQIVDVLGKTVLTINPAATAATVDASSLNSGLYFAKIATATATETVKLMKN